MIKLTTECEKCIHKNVCKNKDNAEHAAQKLIRMTYGPGPNEDYDWVTMTDRLRIDVVFSCPDFNSSVVFR